MPRADGQARRVVQRPSHQPALRYADLIGASVSHRQVRGAAVEGIGPGKVLVPRSEQRPGVDALGRMQCIDRAGRRALALEITVTAADPLQTVRRIEAQDIGDAAPFEHPGVDLPFVATQYKALNLARRIDQRGVELLLSGALEL